MRSRGGAALGTRYAMEVIIAGIGKKGPGGPPLRVIDGTWRFDSSACVQFRSVCNFALCHAKRGHGNR